MKTSKEDKERALNSLRDAYPIGSTVYGICDHVSKSGMMAVIRVLAFKNNQPLWPNWSAHIATGMRLVSKNGRDGLRVNGCGFNRLQHIASSISYALYGDETALKYQDL